MLCDCMLENHTTLNSTFDTSSKLLSSVGSQHAVLLPSIMLPLTAQHDVSRMHVSLLVVHNHHTAQSWLSGCAAELKPRLNH